MLGILLVDKPSGISSHGVVDALRRSFGTRRVGHAGTLDPMATGLLVVAVGAATRFLQYLPLEPKVYEGEILFGVTTESYDADGKVVSEYAIPENLEGRIVDKLPAFLGLIQQVPPMVSAIKKDGQPLYKLAREGKEVEREARSVFIESFEPIDVTDTTMAFRVVCSGGTYIRSLAHDLGAAIGCGAHLTALRRTQVGRFRIEDASILESASVDDLLPLSECLPPMPLSTLEEADVAAIRQGKRVLLPNPLLEGLVGLLNGNGAVFGVARVVGTELQPECVLPIEADHD